MYPLPTYRGYTVDERLREFRRVTRDEQGNPSIEFIPFDSSKGRRLLLQAVRKGALIAFRARRTR